MDKLKYDHRASDAPCCIQRTHKYRGNPPWMPMLKFKIRILSPALGAEINGLDLREDLDIETVEALRVVWLEHLMLLFRDQELSEADEVRVASYFGKPFTSERVPGLGEREERNAHVLAITNIRENGEPIGVLPDGDLQFHSDSAFHENPLMATVLYAIELPSHGGNTLFNNMYQVYDSLDASEKEKLERYQAVNVYDYHTQVRIGRYDRNKSVHAIHPVIRTHPETGRKAVYVNRLMTEEIVGLPETMSDTLLGDLFDLAEREEFIYEHVWRTGDLVIWDNRCAQHARKDFPAEQTRLLNRVGIAGDRPF
jgi:taurine dioxygenase